MVPIIGRNIIQWWDNRENFPFMVPDGVRSHLAVSAYVNIFAKLATKQTCKIYFRFFSSMTSVPSLLPLVDWTIVVFTL